MKTAGNHDILFKGCWERVCSKLSIRYLAWEWSTVPKKDEICLQESSYSIHGLSQRQPASRPDTYGSELMHKIPIFIVWNIISVDW